jgi:peptidoglycan/xylan/chitin deacetylase (PgdA/CDA1 family)
MYHSVSKHAQRDWGPWQYAVTPKTFDRQLSYISEGYTVISLDKFVNWLMNNGSIPRDAVILTFDDGYRDFRRTALPILDNYEFPATIYVPTRLLAMNKAPFEHRLATALSERKELNITVEEFSIDTDLRTHAEIVSSYNYIRNKLKFSSTNRRERVLEAIGEESDCRDIIFNPEDITKLDKNPLITIGAHGHEHVPLGTLSIKQQKENVEASRDQLMELLGTPPRHFCFPYGSFEKSAIRAVKDTGFDSAVTTQSRPVSARDWGRPYKIPRINAATKPIDHSLDVISTD